MRRSLIPLFVLLLAVGAPSGAEDDHHHDHDHDSHEAGKAAGSKPADDEPCCDGDEHDSHGDHDDHAPHAKGGKHADHDSHGEGAKHADHESPVKGDDHDSHGHGSHDDHHDEAPTGPHGGRLVEGGGLSAEVVLFEQGVAPQLRVWVREGDTIVDPSKVRLEVTLRRLARLPERLTFQPRGDFLLADQAIDEPHSFAIDVKAQAGGKTLAASYESLEARVTIPAEEAAAGGVTSAVAGPRDLGRALHLTGRIGIPSHRMAEVHPRFAGVVREASGTIGDRVSRGQALATLESNTTLARFSVVSPFDGVLLDRKAVVGGSAAEDDALYVVADLSEVWADLDVYGEDTHVVHVGESVTIRDEAHRDDADAVETTVKISYVSPLRDVHTQTTLARAVLPNGDGRWAPGAFVSASLELAESPAKVAVPPSALQSWRGQTAVFVHAEGIWEARPVRVGRSGDEWVELLSGVDAGTVVATGNTFLLRAEVEKAGAAHDH